MLEKILFSDCDSSNSYQIATEEMFLNFIYFDDKRSSGNIKRGSLDLVYFNSPEKDLIIRDQIIFKENFSIYFAKRELFNSAKLTKVNLLLNSTNEKSEQIPSGYFIYKDKTDEELKKIKNGFTADEKIRLRLIEQTEQILNEFREQFTEMLERRLAQVEKLYPIDPKRFFNEGSEGMGPIFREQFEINHNRHKFNTSLSVAGFKITAKTNKYRLALNYGKHESLDEEGTIFTGTFYINRGDYGFEVLLDENLNAEEIREIGDLSFAVDNKLYSKEDFKRGTGKILYTNVMKIWEEARHEFNIDPKIKLCESLTREELDKADQIIAFSKNKENFPKF